MISDFKDFERDAVSGVWRHRNAAPFDYSDGDVHEEYVYSAIRDAGDVSTSSVDLTDKIVDWPSMYHLSRRRANLLRPAAAWFAGKRVLEIGSGCGAISRFLGESGAHVVGLEGSFRRARIARERCRDLDNVEILCGTSDDAENLGQFDAVLLIGVLEYARKYLGPEGTQRLLATCRARAAESGVLVVAIENQLGLKYLSGEVEDHLSIAMFGVEDRYSAEGVTTFGRRALGRLLTDAGFEHQDWWYPFPDYKMPISVLNDAAMSGEVQGDLSPLITETLALDPQRTYKEVFSPERAWLPVFRNGLGGDLANSFLVFSSAMPQQVVPTSSVAYHYSAERRREYAKQVRIDANAEGALKVVRSKIFPESVPVSSTAVMSIEDDPKFSGGSHWQQRLSMITATEGWSIEDFEGWFDVWFKAVVDRVDVSAERIDEAFLSTEISSEFIDATPRNLLVQDDTAVQFIDLEWRLDHPIELGYLLFRGVYVSLGSLGAVAVPKADTPMRFADFFEAAMSSRGVVIAPETLERYMRKEMSFASLTSGKSVDFDVMVNARLHVRPPFLEELTRARDRLASLEADVGYLKQVNVEKDEQMQAVNGELLIARDQMNSLVADVAFMKRTNLEKDVELERVSGELMVARDQLSSSVADVAFLKRLISEKDLEIDRLMHAISVQGESGQRKDAFNDTAGQSMSAQQLSSEELAEIKASRAYALEQASRSPRSLKTTASMIRLAASIILPDALKAPVRRMRQGSKKGPK